MIRNLILTLFALLSFSSLVVGQGIQITGTKNACVGLTSTLRVGGDTTGTGTASWISGNTAVATVGLNTGVVTGVSAGTSTITYSKGNIFATAVFTVNPLPAKITGPTTVSVGGTITLRDATPGGTWSNNCPSILTLADSALVSDSVLTGTSPGTCSVYYTLPTGCDTYTTIIVTGHSITPINGLTHICLGSTSSLSDSTSGGSWSSSNTDIAVVDLNGVVTGYSAGTCTITYTAGVGSATVSFTVNPQPKAITGPTKVSEGNVITLSDTTADGTWSSGDPTYATIDSMSGTVKGVLAGSSGILYTLTTGCSAYYIVKVFCKGCPVR